MLVWSFEPPLTSSTVAVGSGGDLGPVLKVENLEWSDCEHVLAPPLALDLCRLTVVDCMETCGDVKT